jgi:hypothetical protein
MDSHRVSEQQAPQLVAARFREADVIHRQVGGTRTAETDLAGRTVLHPVVPDRRSPEPRPGPAGGHRLAVGSLPAVLCRRDQRLRGAQHYWSIPGRRRLGQHRAVPARAAAWLPGRGHAPRQGYGHGGSPSAQSVQLPPLPHVLQEGSAQHHRAFHQPGLQDGPWPWLALAAALDQ